MDAEATLESEQHGRASFLYQRHARTIGRIAYLMTGDQHQAEDLVQEAFTRVFARLGTLRSEDAFQAYLRRTVVNLARKQWHKAATERAWIRSHGAVRETTNLPDLAERDRLWRALLRLPFRQRAAIVLRYANDLSERDTARTLGCATGTVKSLVSRGLQTMRQEMEVEDQ